MRRSLSFLLTFALLGQSSAWAWWEIGHRTVARIAAAHLTPAARTRIARILEVPDNPQAIADALAVASTWADETKGQTGTGDWHFIDLNAEDSKDEISARCFEDNCAPARIHIFALELRNHQSDRRWSELDQLRYVVHLVGDLHQPLHTITDDDQGGNCEQLVPQIGPAKNLHGLWDGGIIAEMSGADVEFTAAAEKRILAMSEHERDRISAGSVNDWTWESHLLALHDVYQRLHVPILRPYPVHGCSNAPLEIREFHPQVDGLYIDSMKPVVMDQLTKAGLRLARLLNESM